MLALKSSGMELRKWASNDQDLMATIPLEHRCKQTSLSWDNADTIKTLAKIILKEITLAKQYREDGSSTSLDWDEPVPNTIAVKWQQFRQQLMKVKTIKIPRSVKFTPLFSSEIQLHTFCDGSSSAYAAAVYARTQQSDGTFYTTLIVAKSKISPTKPLTIPRTELCGAVLATKLTKWVLENNRWTNAHISTFYWTDATIVLHWIKGDITRWKTFVANRVSYILDHTSAAQWHHIDTSENPADCATRGLPPSQIPDIWWHGPSWLCKPHNIWPNTQSQLLNPEERDLEAKSIKIRAFTTLSDTKDSIIDRFSSYTKLLRVTAYMLRFCHNAHARAQRSHGSLSPDELDEALCCIARLAQSDTFHADIQALKRNKPLPPRSTLSNLTPFLDNNILRIRGHLVIQHSHQLTLHGGAQLTLAHIRYKFWIPRGRQAVRRIIRKCVTCFKELTTLVRLNFKPRVYEDQPPTKAM
ncbi:uncharacterized protein LOC122618898 [Drosophila teissieri]|uniref:uncharacterized protein LOC122618898 n=1 Tax=Drosophila teissieri TaxID=7243 RepID=UPI001CBA49F7|nr:uncharacterized protein LOC122618898 [Drosophila teissieri]